jgi:uncharacterized cupin superfamily protein
MSSETASPLLALTAAAVAPRPKRSFYPPPFSARVEGRTKRVLGEAFGLRNFGVNLTRLEPGAQSALLHRHTRQDEFIYVLEGTPTLLTDTGAVELAPGMCAGFPAGGVAHHLVNRSAAPVVFLEIGDRSPGDAAEYPADDLVLEAGSGVPGGYRFTKKDGTAY